MEPQMANAEALELVEQVVSDAVSKKSGDVVNVLLFQRLITVFSAVLDAAAMSNNWILIDRTNNGSSSTAELLPVPSEHIAFVSMTFSFETGGGSHPFSCKHHGAKISSSIS